MFDDLNGVFLITCLTLFCACISLIIRYIFKSKCKKFKCCGITIERDVDAELEEEKMEIDAGLTMPPTPRASGTKDN
jgi:hypothetical protein